MKKTLIILILTILITPLVYGAESYYTNIVAGYNFENTGTTEPEYYSNYYNISLSTSNLRNSSSWDGNKSLGNTTLSWPTNISFTKIPNTSAIKTLSFWMKPYQNTTGNYWADGGSTGAGSGYFDASNRLAKCGSASCADNVIVSNTNTSYGTWRHVIIVFNGSTSRVYFNGSAQSVTIGGTPNQIIYTNQTFMSGQGYYFRGNMDNLCLYDKAINSSEASLIYQYEQQGYLCGKKEVTSIINTTINYTNPVYENTQQLINLTTLFTNYEINNISNITNFTLNYNNTNYTISNYSYSTTNTTIGYYYVTTPLTSNSTAYVPLYFNYTINYANGTNVTTGTSTQIQTVLRNATLLNLTFSQSVNVCAFDYQSYCENTSNFVIVLRNRPEDVIKVRFKLNNSVNFSQFYEFENDLSDHTASVQIIQNIDTYAYIKVLDYGLSPIQKATVEIYQANLNYSDWTNYSFIGQRLTDEQGYVYFEMDSSSVIRLYVHKTGYTPSGFIIKYVGEILDTPASDPIIIYIANTVSETNETIIVSTKKAYNNASENIPVLLADPNIEDRTFVITTQYAINNGFSPLTTYTSMFKSQLYSLTSGTYFNSTGNENITLLIYEAGSLIKNITIEYIGINTEILPVSVFNITDDIDDGFIPIILVIAVITIASITGLFLKNTEASKHVFFGGIIITGLISTTLFWAAAIAVLHYVLKIVQKVISE